MGLFGTAKPDVEKLEAKQDIPGLIKAMQYKHDVWIPIKAVQALGRIKDARAVPALCSEINDLKGNRLYAIVALGEIGDESALDTLINLLSDESSFVREAVVQALGKIGGAKCIPSLVKACKDPDNKVASAAFEAIRFSCGEGIGSPLLQALKDSDKKVKQAAAYALSRLKDRNSVADLITLLSDESVAVRRAAATALGMIGNDRAVDPLIKILEGTDIDKDEAVLALGEIGDPKAIEPLASLRGENPYSVALSLAKLGDSRDIKTLIKLIYDIYALHTERAQAVAVLGKLAIPGDVSDNAYSVIWHSMMDKEEDIREAAVMAVEKFVTKERTEEIINRLERILKTDQSEKVRRSAQKTLDVLKV